MPKTLVLFHSRFGATAALADAIAEGARSERFSEVTVRRLDDRSPLGVAHIEELADYDGIILGSPSHGGVMSAEVKHLLGQAEPLRVKGAFANTVGSAFASVSSTSSDQDAAMWSILATVGSLGMILVPPARGDTDLAAAARQGKRVAEVVSWVTHARSHGHSHSHAH